MLNDSYRPGSGVGGPFSATLPAQLDHSNPLSGTGSPEGVVQAVPGQTYTDLASQILWEKIQSNGVYGWKAVGSVP